MSDIFYIESGKFPSPCEATRNKMWCVRDEVVSGTQAGPDTTVKQLFGYE